MATMFNTQVGEGRYALQFETTDRNQFLCMQDLARRCVDDTASEPETDIPEEPRTYEITAIHTVEVTKILKHVAEEALQDHMEHLKEVTPGALEDLLKDILRCCADDIKTVNAQVFVREETPKE